MPDLKPGRTTLAVLRGLVADETDQPPPTPFTNVPIALYNQFINRSYRENVGLMVDSFQDYFVNPDSGNPYTFTTDGANYLYDQPDDFWKLLGMDCLWIPGNMNTAVTMREFMKLERNKWQYFAGSCVMVPEYKITGNQIWLIPQPPQANYQILVRYVPVLPDMVDVGTITITSGIVAGDSVWVAALPEIPQGPPVAGVFPELTPQIQYVAIPNGTAPSDAEGRIEFAIGLTTIETASNLAAAMNRGSLAGFPHVPWSTGSDAQDANVATVTSNGTTVSVTLLQALCIVWSTESANDATKPANGIALAPLPVATQWNPYGSWFNFCTVLNGWDELTIVDAAIKVLGKQQQGAQDMKQRKVDLWADVRTQSNNRNAASNPRISNVRRGRSRWGLGGGSFGVR